MASIQQQIPLTWPKIRKIAVVTDFSQNSGTALWFAAPFARVCGADIILAHAYLPPSCAYAAPTIELVCHTLETCRNWQADRLLGETETACLRDIKSSALLHEGSAEDLVKELAGVDLIVAGGSGSTGLGSTAETVFRTSTVPVLTVGRKCHWSAREANAIKTILYATDLTCESATSLAYALSITKKHEARLVLLHSVRRNDRPFLRDRAARSGEALEQLGKIVPDGIDLGCQPKYIVASGTAEETILREAKREKADLIVVGARRRGKLATAATLRGAGIAHQVALHADCPVLTIRHA